MNVADGDQREMALREIVTAYKSGTVGDETFVWKDGMPEWLLLREVPEIVAAAKK